MPAITPPFIPSFGNGPPGSGGRGQPPLYFDQGNGYALWVFKNGVWHQSSSGVLLPVAIVQKQFGTLGGANSNTITLGAAPTAGNLLVFLAGPNTNAGSLTPANGYTIDAYAASFISEGALVAHKTAGASEPAAQSPCTNNLGGSGVLYEISGGAGILDVIAHTENFSTTALVQALTPGGTNGICLFYGSTETVQSGSSWAVAGGMTSDGQGNQFSRAQACGHIATPTTATVTPGITLDTASSSGNQAISVNIR